jgi:hypothetical protein
MKVAVYRVVCISCNLNDVVSAAEFIVVICVGYSQIITQENKFLEEIIA